MCGVNIKSRCSKRARNCNEGDPVQNPATLPPIAVVAG